ncbi:hypothetical protein [Acinetobacter sp. IK40]|uniref:hypothetical protein n=1 Tax=Acinetobacter sp. IK40 TaxID=2928897 RepID=UPI002D1E4FD6|nr:hypothetical protein [Acinetobacter sp. IK40]MEB3790144.1 hypothetical protein [Acinetobacter sp. IK40]
MIVLIAICLMVIAGVLLAFYFKSYPVNSSEIGGKITNAKETLLRPKPIHFERYVDLQQYVYSNIDCELKHFNPLVGKVSKIYSEEENAQIAILTGDIDPIKMVQAKLLTDQGVIDVELFIPKKDATVSIGDLIIAIPQELPPLRFGGGVDKLQEKFAYIASGTIEPIYLGKNYGWKPKEIFIDPNANS